MSGIHCQRHGLINHHCWPRWLAAFGVRLSTRCETVGEAVLRAHPGIRVRGRWEAVPLRGSSLLLPQNPLLLAQGKGWHGGSSGNLPLREETGLRERQRWSGGV